MKSFQQRTTIAQQLQQHFAKCFSVLMSIDKDDEASTTKVLSQTRQYSQSPPQEQSLLIAAQDDARLNRPGGQNPLDVGVYGNRETPVGLPGRRTFTTTHWWRVPRLKYTPTCVHSTCVWWEAQTMAEKSTSTRAHSWCTSSKHHKPQALKVQQNHVALPLATRPALHQESWGS